MHQKSVALWIMILFLVHHTKTATYEVNVTRLLDPSKGDKYFIPSASCKEYKCSDFGGAKSGNSDCICGCPSSNATFSKYNGMLGCYKHVPDSEECKLRFFSQRPTSNPMTLRRGNFEVISFTRACKLVYVRYFGNKGTWTDVSSSQLSSFTLIHGRRGPTVSTALEIKSTLSKALDGTIIKLGTTCSCLVFKLEGTRVCKIPVVKTMAVETTTKVTTIIAMSTTAVKEREIQGSNKDGTTTTDLIVIGACAAAASIGVSIFCVLFCNMKRRREREAKAHQASANTNTANNFIDQRFVLREQQRPADNVSICRSQGSSALPVSDVNDLQDPQAIPVIVVPASATNTYPNQRQFYLTQDNRALSVQSLNLNTTDRYRRQRRDTSPLIRYKNVPQVPDTRTYQCMNERYVVLQGDQNGTPVIVHAPPDRKRARTFGTTSPSSSTLNEENVYPSTDRLQNPKGKRVLTAPPKFNLVKPNLKQGTESIPLGNISSPSQSSQETPPLDRSTKPKTLRRAKTNQEAVRSQHEKSAKSSNKKHNSQISSSEDDLPPIDRSKKPKNSSTFPTYAKAKEKKNKSVRCQTAPSISTNEVYAKSSQSQQYSDHDYDCYNSGNETEHDYEEVEADDYDLKKSDAHFNPTEQKQHSNEFESPYDTDSSHDYDIPEGDVWNSEIHKMGQTTGTVHDRENTAEDDICSKLTPLENGSCIEETEIRKPVATKEPHSDETKSKPRVMKPPRKKALNQDAPIAESRAASLDSGFNSLGRIDEDNNLENKGIPDTQSKHE